MMTFVYWRGEIAHKFAAALAERARAGVRVRLMLDGSGSRLIEKGELDLMDEAGVDVAWFRKPLYLSPLKQNHRCHRKVLVVDEHTAFTGGVGIAQEWCGNARNENEWRDTHVQVTGPAVDGLAAAFAQNWAECHDELFDDRDRFVSGEHHGDSVVQVVRGSASFGWQDMQTLIRVVLESAEERVRLATAYFAPDDYFTGLLCDTARRGVEVEILLPGPHTDKRVCQLAGQRYYEDLTACGVKIYQYQPTMMHTKTLTIDRVASLVGSTNFNRRSLDHDEEVMLAVLDRDFTATLDGHFDEDRQESVLIEPGRWKRRDLRRGPGKRPSCRSVASCEYRAGLAPPPLNGLAGPFDGRPVYRRTDGARRSTAARRNVWWQQSMAARILTAERAMRRSPFARGRRRERLLPSSNVPAS